ncbi:MAG: Na(+)-translocating NADH-quinone reductase subunit A [Pseudomonadota bacterium]
MATEYHLKKGLDLPVTGAPAQEITSGPAIRSVGLLGNDYLGLKPRLQVSEGDTVGAGAPIFAHKDTPDAPVTAPASGRVAAINRGARRRLISVVIEVDDTAAEPLNFASVGDVDSADGLRQKLCTAGLWGAFRTRPYSKVPDPASMPAAIFINAMDSEPLAPDAGIVIADAAEDFERGVQAIAQLHEVPTYLCHAPEATIPGSETKGVTTATFGGPHPAGLAGTHVHFLHPPTAERSVWTIGYPDVIAIGKLLRTNQLDTSRVISLGGPLVRKPRLLRVPAGASLRDLTRGEYDDSVASRIISGSILSGVAPGDNEAYFLGRYARQVTVIEEDRKQNLLGWIRPMRHKYAVQPVLGSMLSRRAFPLTSNLNGGRRAMVPTGTFEALMPQDYLPTQLLRALLVMDTDMAQALGALELDEEDLGLVGFACPAKYEYGIALRDCLTKIEKDG